MQIKRGDMAAPPSRNQTGLDLEQAFRAVFRIMAPFAVALIPDTLRSSACAAIACKQPKVEHIGAGESPPRRMSLVLTTAADAPPAVAEG